MAVTPTVSVVMAVYNGDSYIRSAIDSVINQTYTDWELLIVDDGSSDNTPQILNEYAERDTRLRIVQQSNQGQTRALNHGLSLARGRYVARLDGDDLML